MKKLKKIFALLSVVMLLCFSTINTNAVSSVSTPNQPVVAGQLNVPCHKILNAKKNSKKVWISKNGSKYHCKKSCSKMKNPKKVTLSKAKKNGYKACKKCY